MIGPVTVNGEPSDGLIPVTDSSVLRGDGCFEVIKAYAGRVFELEPHLDRLERSARSLEIDLPDRADLRTWIEVSAGSIETGAVRVVVTRGSAVPGLEDGPRVIVFSHPWDRGPDHVTLLPVAAPWHAAGQDWALAGAKVISYAPNLSATRVAQNQGFGDALLTTVDDVILEGPTFSVAWMVDGVLETPTLGLGILDSITRRVGLDLARDTGLEVVEGEWPLAHLDAADEVMAMSTIREIQPVVAVGDTVWEPGEITGSLADEYSRLTG